MDAVKLEARWPPDRRPNIGASEFGIYKEPAGGKRLRGTDVATGCLLVLSLVTAAAVVLYFAFFDYTIPSTQAVAASIGAGPSASYAKYVKDKQTTLSNGAVAADYGLLAAVLGVKHAENLTSAADEATTVAKRVDNTESTAGHGHQHQYHLRTMRLFPVPGRRPLPPAVHAAYEPSRHDGGKRVEYYPDGMYGFGRRTDFAQLAAAYRAPFPPKSVLDVMKYVTGAPPYRLRAATPDRMLAQESKLPSLPRYVAIRPADDVNRFLPDAGGPPHSGSTRFRNKFGPPVFLTPPVQSHPDDFMKPPSLGASYSADFERPGPAELGLGHDGQSSATVQSHTDAVFHSQPVHNDYPVPDTPVPKRSKNKRAKGKKPISVMLDIYPLPLDGDREEDEEEEENFELFNSLKNNIQQSNRDNMMFRLNLFPKFSEGGGRRISKQIMNEKQSPIHLTTETPLEDEEHNENVEDEIPVEYDYPSESKHHVANISNVQL